MEAGGGGGGRTWPREQQGLVSGLASFTPPAHVARCKLLTCSEPQLLHLPKKDNRSTNSVGPEEELSRLMHEKVPGAQQVLGGRGFSFWSFLPGRFVRAGMRNEFTASQVILMQRQVTALCHFQNLTPRIVPREHSGALDDIEYWKVKLLTVGKGDALLTATAVSNGPAPQKRGGRSDLPRHGSTPVTAHSSLKGQGTDKWRQQV